MTNFVIPIKDLSRAKSRLSDILSPQERAGLTLAMMEDLLTVIRACEPGNIWVVSSDAAALELAKRFDARIVHENGFLGYNGAVTLGLQACQPDRPVAVIPGDVPLATAREVRCLVAPSDKPQPVIRIASDRHMRGTNGLYLSSPDLIAPAFGVNSIRNHQAASRAAAVKPEQVDLPGLAQDIDTAEDLIGLAHIARNSRTADYLKSIRLASRQSVPLRRGAA